MDTIALECIDRVYGRMVDAWALVDQSDCSPSAFTDLPSSTAAKLTVLAVYGDDSDVVTAVAEMLSSGMAANTANDLLATVSEDVFATVLDLPPVRTASLYQYLFGLKKERQPL